MVLLKQDESFQELCRFLQRRGFCLEEYMLKSTVSIPQKGVSRVQTSLLELDLSTFCAAVKSYIQSWTHSDKTFVTTRLERLQAAVQKENRYHWVFSCLDALGAPEIVIMAVGENYFTGERERALLSWVASLKPGERTSVYTLLQSVDYSAGRYRHIAYVLNTTFSRDLTVYEKQALQAYVTLRFPLLLAYKKLLDTSTTSHLTSDTRLFFDRLLLNESLKKDGTPKVSS